MAVYFGARDSCLVMCVAIANAWQTCFVSVVFDGFNFEQGAEIEKLDSVENMGIQFIEGQWFVFGMCKKVTKNIKVIDRILASIREFFLHCVLLFYFFYSPPPTHHIHLSLSLSLCMCVCVRETERERERKKRERDH